MKEQQIIVKRAGAAWEAWGTVVVLLGLAFAFGGSDFGGIVMLFGLFIFVIGRLK